jgi:putative Mg2+ transporter-C (MgtC) family protein
MWMAGALGVACGAGYYVLALIATALTVVILAALKRMEQALSDEGRVASASGRERQLPNG